MSKVSIYNVEGKTVGELELSPAVFGVKVNPALVHQVLVGQRANARRAIASTKTKGEVSGGGKKPWRQKGTGRARQGSTRSPNWVGGGIVFGPSNERNFSVKINRKTKKRVMCMILSDKLADKKLIIVDAINTESPKTKVVATMMKALPVGKTSLVVAPASQPVLLRMIRNMPNVKLITANTLNTQDVLKYQSLVLLKDAVPVVEKIYA